MTQYTDTITDNIGAGEQYVNLGRVLAMAESLGVSEVDLNLGVVMSATDNVGVSEALRTDLGLWLLETLGVTDTTSAAQKIAVILLDQPTIASALLTASGGVITDNVGVSEALVALRAVALVEALGLTDTLAAAAKYYRTFTDTIGIDDLLQLFVSGSLTDNVGVSEALAYKFNMYLETIENVGISETLAQKLVFRMDMADTVTLTDAQLLKQVFSGQLLDGVEVTAGYVSPNGTVTTWVINTKNFAATEYTNFDFNSFAQMGNKFLGATSTGLYELNGDTDDGAAIIADIKSGLMQLGGSRFTSFKTAYLGMRGEGDFVLRLETGDGKTYNYAVVGKSMQSARVHFGKGLRSRYFSFELISTGQDFDLDTVEFLPLVAQRRV